MRAFLIVLLISTCLFAQEKSPDTKPAQPPRSGDTPAHAASGTDPSAAAAPTSKAIGWRIQERKASDGTREVALVLNSEKAMGGDTGSQPAHLAIRCSQHKLEVFIHIGNGFEGIPGKTDAVDVGIKFDGAAQVKQRWLAAADHKAALASSPVTLVKQMAESTTALFTFTPFQKQDTTVTFKMGDLKEKLQSVSHVCGL